MSIIKPQFQTIITVAQTSQFPVNFNKIEPQFQTIITVAQTSQLSIYLNHNFKQLMMSPKPVNYEYNQATISNNQFRRPNPPIMNIVETQILTNVTVA